MHKLFKWQAIIIKQNNKALFKFSCNLPENDKEQRKMLSLWDFSDLIIYNDNNGQLTMKVLSYGSILEMHFVNEKHEVS